MTSLRKRQTIWPCVYAYKARKEYICDICGEKIPIGEDYGKREVGNRHYHLKCMMIKESEKNRNICLYCPRTGHSPIYDKDQYERLFIRGYVCEVHRLKSSGETPT